MKRVAGLLGARPATKELAGVTQSNKDDIVEVVKLGGGLICRVLQMTPSTYGTHALRVRPSSAKGLSNAGIGTKICETVGVKSAILWGAKALERNKPRKD